MKKRTIPLPGNRFPGSWIYIAMLLVALSDIGFTFFYPGISDTALSKTEIIHMVMMIVVSLAVFCSLKSKNAAVHRMGKRLSEMEMQAKRDKTIIKTLYNQMPCGVIGVSPSYEILFFNKGAEDITGVCSQAALGRKCYDIFGNGRICQNCSVAKVVCTKTAYRTTLQRKYKDKPVYIDHTTMPVLKEDGSIHYILDIGLDVSKQIELQKINQSLFMETVTSLSKLIGSRDHSTSTHSQRVRDIAISLGERMGLSQEEKEALSVTAILHDIGKIGIPENILNKTGKLTEREFAIIQNHPVIGYEAIKNVSPLENVAEYILHHHEAYDGTGYPHGLKQEEIPLISRILSIADVFEAITADRVYRRAMSWDQARAIMIEGRGTKFDPEILDIFVELLDSGAINASYRSSQENTQCGGKR